MEERVPDGLPTELELDRMWPLSNLGDVLEKISSCGRCEYITTAEWRARFRVAM